jgi:hypothetical protein
LIYRYISVKKRQNLNNYIPDKNIGNDTFNSTVKPLISDSGKMDFLGDNRDLLGVRCPPFALQAPEGRQVSGSWNGQKNGTQSNKPVSNQEVRRSNSKQMWFRGLSGWRFSG